MEEEQTIGTEIGITEVTEENNSAEVQENYVLTGQDEPDQEQEVQETTEEVPADDGSYNEFYSEQLELTNHLLAGQIFFLGVIFGVLLFKVFWDRWKV